MSAANGFGIFVLFLLLELGSGKEELGMIRQLASFRGNDKVQFSISVFGEEMLFNFTRTKRRFIHPGFKIETKSGSISEDTTFGRHFTYESPSYIASLSDYGEGEMYGFVSGKGRTIEIHPLGNVLQAALRRNPFAYGRRHSDISDVYLMNEIQLPHQLEKDEFTSNDYPKPKSLYKNSFRLKQNEDLTIELAVFVDEEAYDGLVKLYNSTNQVFNILLAYMNQIHAIFRMRSLGVNVDINLKKLVILDSHARFPKHEGERSVLLKSFCRYQSEVNPSREKNRRNHWDLGVLFTGLDLWTTSSKGERDYSTLGIAPTGGMCSGDYSCALAELRGSVRGKYGSTISSGFTSSYIMAHEIGHSLGLSHDGNGDCSENGFIMSPTRDVRGEAKWSACSAEKLKRLRSSLSCLTGSKKRIGTTANTKYKGVPGFYIKKDKQCRQFLRDRKASAAVSRDVCNSLLCRGSDGAIHEAGPALTGTSCGTNAWCKDGECSNRPQWSKWAYGPCKSGCLQSSLGTRVMSRRCLGGSDCIGLHTRTQLCDDNSYCEKKSAQRTITFISRKSRTLFADRQCKGYAQRSNFLLRSPPGKVGAVTKYNEKDPERACIIYCRSRDKGWVSPSSAEKKPIYFPEGTWCYFNDKTDTHYYCVNHRCLPKKERRRRN